MKRMLAVFIACTLFLTGCASDRASDGDAGAKKKSRIEIYSVEDELLSTIENQDTILNLLNHDNWSETGSLPGNLTPEKKLLVYQEKTLLAGQDLEEARDYELIETIILFQDSPYVMEVFSGDVVKNMAIPEGLLSFYYELPDSAAETIRSFLEPQHTV